MNKVLKWILIVVGGLITLVIIAAGSLFFIGRSNLANAPEITGVSVTAATGEDALARGEHLMHISSCNECHTANLAGAVFVDEAPIGYVPASNLTSGAGGIGSTYTDADWELAIRHGVAADGRTMVTMPSDHYAHYSDEDLAALITYMKSVPPVDNDLGARELLFPGTIIFGVFANSSWPVNIIDHPNVGREAPAAGPTAEYGQYLVSIASCQSCHAENLAGNYGQLDTPQGPNLTAGGNLGQWSFDEFATAMRSGSTPDGRQLDEIMPWGNYAAMTEDELQALWTYLISLEPLPNNTP